MNMKPGIKILDKMFFSSFRLFSTTIIRKLLMERLSVKTATSFSLFDYSLIEGAIDLGVLEVDIAKPLCKEGITLVSFRKQDLRGRD